jgi:hypothetical protein
MERIPPLAYAAKHGRVYVQVRREAIYMLGIIRLQRKTDFDTSENLLHMSTALLPSQ